MLPLPNKLEGLRLSTNNNPTMVTGKSFSKVKTTLRRTKPRRRKKLPQIRPSEGWRGGGGAHSCHHSRCQNQLQATPTKMLRQENRGKEVRIGRPAKSPPTPTGGGEKRSHRRRRQRTPIFRIILLSKPGSSGAGANGGMGTHSPFKPHPRCLPTFSESPCHRTSSSWKLPLGSALRMPNSISQGACQQPGWGLRNGAAAIGAAPGHPAPPLPTLWLRERRGAAPQPGRAPPLNPGAQKPRGNRAAD